MNEAKEQLRTISNLMLEGYDMAQMGHIPNSKVLHLFKALKARRAAIENEMEIAFFPFNPIRYLKRYVLAFEEWRHLDRS